MLKETPYIDTYVSCPDGDTKRDLISILHEKRRDSCSQAPLSCILYIHILCKIILLQSFLLYLFILRDFDITKEEIE